MLRHRCPWCGEQLPILHTRKYVEKKSPCRCPACKKAYTIYCKGNKGNGRKFTAIGMSALLLICFLCIPFRPPFSIVRLHFPWWGMLLCVVGMVFVFLWGLSLPCAREKDPENRTRSQEKQKTSVCLLWKKHKAAGLFLARAQVPNGEIFPAVFQDENGKIISTALCIVLENIEWSGRRNCRCDISLVLDNIPVETLFCAGNRVNLFYKDRCIATGVL